MGCLVLSLEVVVPPVLGDASLDKSGRNSSGPQRPRGVVLVTIPPGETVSALLPDQSRLVSETPSPVCIHLCLQQEAFHGALRSLHRETAHSVKTVAGEGY